MANQVAFIVKLLDRFSAKANRISKSAMRMNRAFDGVQKKAGQTARKMKVLSSKTEMAGKSMDRFSQKSRKAAMSVDAAGKGAKKAGFNFTAFAGALTALPVAALGLSFIKAASDAGETQQKFDTIFKGMQDQANATAVAFADNFNIARDEAKRLVGDTADLLTGFKFSKEAALEMSLQVQRLGSDLASFNNLQGGTARASEILTKALLGERDSLIALGIKISEDDVKRRAAVLVLKGQTFETDLAAKAAATYSLVLEQSGNALGDVSRSSGSLQFKTNLLTKQWRELTITLGNEFIPAAKMVLDAVSSIFTAFKELAPEQKTLIRNMAFGAAGALILGGAIAALSAPIVLTIAGVAALGAAVGFVITRWDSLVLAFERLSESPTIIGFVVDRFSLLFKIIGLVFDKSVELFDLIADFIMPAGLQKFLDSAGDFLGIGAVKQFFETVVSPVSFEQPSRFVPEDILRIPGDRPEERPTPFRPGLGERPPEIPNPFGPGLGAAQTGSVNRSDVQITLTSPRGAIEKVKTKTSGDKNNFDLGFNMKTT